MAECSVCLLSSYRWVHVSFAWHPLRRIPSSSPPALDDSNKSSSSGCRRNLRLASAPKDCSKWVPISHELVLFMLVSDVKCCRMDSNGIVLGLLRRRGCINNIDSFLTEEGPICSFSFSIRPPLWHESDTIVKLAPFGTRLTICRKSSSTIYIYIYTYRN